MQEVLRRRFENSCPQDGFDGQSKSRHGNLGEAELQDEI